ncbi:MAG: hypothetical protein O3B41_00800 [Bacteroidetes bacterium]|nr:hypothetical protein [Bacteroidota bacterium]
MARSKGRSSSIFEGGVGFSLVGPQWYTGGSIEYSRRTSPYYLHLAGLVRAGVYGAYLPDTDEFYDLVRLVQSARYGSPTGGKYVRIGPLDRTRLGAGHLVNFLNSEAALDAKTVGFEVRLASKSVALEGFSENITSIGLIGARLSFQPFSGTSSPFSSLSVSTTVVSDQKKRLSTNNPIDGQEVGIRMQAYSTGGFSFNPFVSVARLPGFGQGIMFGADVAHDNFVDFARLHFRLALHYNSADFKSGYFGAFYTVNSHRAQVVSEDESQREGFDLRSIERGNSVETELRMYVFNRFEFWYSFHRYHGIQPLSEYHLRFRFLADRFNVSIGQDRAGLVGFKSLFESLGDENRLRFEFEYRLVGPLWTRVLADYTYVEVGKTVDSLPKYIVQRRFSPIVVLRYPSQRSR